VGVRVGVRVCVAYSRNKLALRTRVRNLNLRSHFCIFDSFREVCGRFVSVKVGVANSQSIGIDENNTF